MLKYFSKTFFHQHILETFFKFIFMYLYFYKKIKINVHINNYRVLTKYNTCKINRFECLIYSTLQKIH